MRYTVTQLAKISGVSVRTLHWYDEIGLLKPAYYQDNGYRYYEKEQLLLLQQILFFRELGFKLNDIQKIIESDAFDKIEALQTHRSTLVESNRRLKSLIQTIDKTILHLKGEKPMTDKELYYGFDSQQQKRYEKDLVKMGIVNQEFMDTYNEKTNQWTQKDKDHFVTEGKDINDALIAAMNQKLLPSCEEVQAIIHRHHAWVGWNPTKDRYMALSELYHTPEFAAFYKQLHPELLEFITEAMGVYARKNLS
ncbi:MAG: MerR family transcriptional regulator [Alphaproteobacteria bacterium]|nr:MerR family transcriptional regulator [Alphaproteobacteria bacterium]